jgi:hypothetical protein
MTLQNFRSARFERLTAALLALALAGPISAQQSERFGDYEVHYSAINTRMLTPEVARAYGIQRAGTRALLNIAVRTDNGSRAVAARVTASARSLTGQRQTIGMEEIREEDAIYQIGTFGIENEEWMTFTIEVQPEGRRGPPFSFTFRQQFYTD